jgi:ribosomal protein S27AE
MTMASKYEFGERGHVLKEETERALENPNWFVGRMKATHNRGDGPQPVEIRLKGNSREALALAAQLCDVFGMAATIKKMEIDKSNRVGNYDAENILIYLAPDVPEVRDHDEIAERALRLKRAVCPKCRMLMSPREIARKKCGNCGTEVPEEQPSVSDD